MQDIVRVGTTATIRNTVDLKAAIDIGLTSNPALALDIGELVEADTSFIELVEAARRRAAVDGKGFTLCAPINPAIAALLDRAGVTAAAGPADLSFWFHGDLPA